MSDRYSLSLPGCVHADGSRYRMLIEHVPRPDGSYDLEGTPVFVGGRGEGCAPETPHGTEYVPMVQFLEELVADANRGHAARVGPSLTTPT